ncbi:MAG TPA: TetR/AcrR family transcriptional regulator [Bacillota bacterium]
MNSGIEDKRELVINTAIRFFTRQGFRKTSMDEIAHAARVSKATIYQMFGDKSGLLGEVYKQKGKELYEKMLQAIAPGTATIPQLLQMLSFAREFCSQDPLFSQFMDQREIEELEAIPQFQDIVSDSVDLIDKLLTQGIARGEIRPMPTRMASYFMFRIGFYISQYGRELFTMFSMDDILNFFDSVLTRGIAADDGRRLD